MDTQARKARTPENLPTQDQEIEMYDALSAFFDNMVTPREGQQATFLCFRMSEDDTGCALAVAVIDPAVPPLTKHVLDPEWLTSATAPQLAAMKGARKAGDLLDDTLTEAMAIRQMGRLVGKDRFLQLAKEAKEAARS